jgi:hypothetical protein
MNTLAKRRSGTAWLLATGLAAGLVAALTVAGCSASGSNDSSAPANKQAAGGGEREAGGAADAANPPAAAVAGPQADNKDANPQAPAQTQAQAPAKLVPDDRSIIYTGSINVRVSDVDAKAAEAITLAIAAGGFVAGDNRTVNASRSEAHLVLRVPSEKFTTTVTQLGHLGKEENRALSTQDVTAEVVDLDARITVAQASVDRVRALLARAQNLNEIVQLESEVSRREADLESLKARQRKLGDLTALSTITAVLLGPDAVGAKPAKKADTGFLAGLKGSWNALGTSLAALLTLLGVLLPWLIALGLPTLAVYWLLRRGGWTRRRDQRAPVAPAIDAPAPETN